MTTTINSRKQHRNRQPRSTNGRRRSAASTSSVPGRNPSDDILTADDRAALEVVLADQEKAKVEPAERLERHFRAGKFILRGDDYATRKTNGAMGRVYANAANEWIRDSGIDQHPLLKRKGTRTNLRKMAKDETGIRFWFEHLDIDDQFRFGHPDTIWEKFRAFLNSIFAAAGFDQHQHEQQVEFEQPELDPDEVIEEPEQPTATEQQQSEEEIKAKQEQAEDFAEDAENEDRTDDDDDQDVDQDHEHRVSPLRTGTNERNARATSAQAIG